MKLIAKRLNLGDIFEIKSDSKKCSAEKKINGLIKWEYLRAYQIEYINCVTNKLLDSNKCIMKSPTGSGKTNMFFWVIIKLFEALKQPKFNILLLTPRIKLCNQSINESYKNILEYNKIKCDYYNYDYENKYDTESKIKDNIKNNIGNNIFISSTYQSIPNIIDFIKKTNLVFDLVIFDEFHYIVSWGNKDGKIALLNNECFKNKLFTSATPYKKQEDNYSLYGELVEKVSVKKLIDQGYLCPIIPLVEIDNDELLTKEEKELKKKIGKYFKLPLLIADTFSRYSKKKAILFCNDTANCWEIYELLQNNIGYMAHNKNN
jgi:superfamily II DNA or RNA helicase